MSRLQTCRPGRCQPAFAGCLRSRRSLAVRADVSSLYTADISSLYTAAAALPLAALGGVAAWRFALYGQLEYITASMLTSYVPKGGPGPRVIQLCGGTRELYYYPKNTVQVTVVGEKMNTGLLEQAGLQAAVPTVAKRQSPANLGFAADGSVDAVVSLGALATMSELQRAVFTSEVLRVLKPGCPVIFMEQIPGGLLTRFVGRSSSTLAESYLRGWKDRKDAFELVQWDVALEGQDPHAVGIAVKSTEYRASVVSRRTEKVAGRSEQALLEKEARKERTRLPKKGFESPPV